MSTFTIIVPIFNEKDNLSRLESELMKFINSTKFKTRVLIINDGSTDGSKEIIEKLCNNNSCFKSISFVRNCGLSSALKAGFDLCNSEYIGYIDADLQTSPSDFHVLLEYIDVKVLNMPCSISPVTEVIKYATMKYPKNPLPGYNNDPKAVS